MKEKTSGQIFNVRNLGLNPVNELVQNGFQMRVFHLDTDPANANRVKLSNGLIDVEMLPNKGFSVGQAWVNGKPVFWEAPIGQPDTDVLDLWSDEICINGNPAPGFAFLKTLTGGIELYGLKNWGMPVEVDGKLHALHGETSNIPVDEVEFSTDGNSCILQTSFIYRSFEGNASLPWYKRGEALFRIDRKLTLTQSITEIRLEDSFENLGSIDLVPDWGYHITFRAETGAKYIVSAQHAEYRGGGELPNEYTIWKPSPDPLQRIEHGVIYKGLKSFAPDHLCLSKLVYPNGAGISVKTSLAPYFQTWMCSGGADSTEFTWKTDSRSFIKTGMGWALKLVPVRSITTEIPIRLFHRSKL